MADAQSKALQAKEKVAVIREYPTSKYYRQFTLSQIIDLGTASNSHHYHLINPSRGGSTNEN